MESLKEYTITTDGSSNGNAIAAPFKIMVNNINNSKTGNPASDKMVISVCTCNAEGIPCQNDVFPTGIVNYELQSMASSDNAKLAATIETDLEAAYPGAWS
jgi:hypothetical protein